jgi:hypothetical protein
MLVMAWDVLRATGGLRAVSDVNQGKDQPVAQPAK